MTDAEKAALKWLDKMLVCTRPDSDAEQAARTLHRMLAEPRLPAEPSEEMLAKMAKAHFQPLSTTTTSFGADQQRLVYRALYAHLTAPKTKTVEVWRVEAAVLCAEGWIPGCHAYRTKAEAERRVPELIAGGWHAVRITGPHKQEVPA